MVEGSVELSSKIACWKAWVHILVIVGLHVLCAIAIGVAGTIDYTSAVAANAEEATKTNGTLAKDMQKAKNGIGVFALVLLMLPTIQCVLQACCTGIGLACRSKCCFGYYAVCTIGTIMSTAVFAIIGLVSNNMPLLSWLVAAASGSDFRLTCKMLGAVGLFSVVNQIYCVFVLCKLSYCDRGAGGADDVLTVGDKKEWKEEEDLYGIEMASEESISESRSSALSPTS